MMARSQVFSACRCLCLCLCLGLPAAAQACSAFAVADSGEVHLAKNFDWHFDGGYLVKNPREVARVALPLRGGEPTTWTSRYGSLVFTQFGAGLPYGGINEPGLAIEMLWLDETVYPATTAPTIGELEWIQYQLDTSASVAEVLAGVDAFSIMPVGGKIHYLLADVTGARALVEFVDGTARVTRADGQPLVCTNDTRRLSELAFEGIRKTKLKGNSSRVRYTRLRLALDAEAVPQSVAGAFAALESVQERGPSYRTRWSTVYEMRRRHLHVRPDGAPATLTLDAATFDYTPQSGTTYLDLFDRDAQRLSFVPLTKQAQGDLLKRNFPKVGVADQLEAIAAHLLDPTTSTVRPFTDRATLHVRVAARAPGAFARIAVFSSQREIDAKASTHAGSVLLDTAEREFAFYNLPLGRYAVGAFHDLDQDGRPGDGEPLAFFRPDPAATGSDFLSISFDLDTAGRVVDIELR